MVIEAELWLGCDAQIVKALDRWLAAGALSEMIQPLVDERSTKATVGRVVDGPASTAPARNCARTARPC